MIRSLVTRQSRTATRRGIWRRPALSMTPITLSARTNNTTATIQILFPKTTPTTAFLPSSSSSSSAHQRLFFSTQQHQLTVEEENYALNRWVGPFGLVRYLPLGTLTAKQWSETMHLLASCLQQTPPVHHNGEEEEEQTHSPKDDTHRLLLLARRVEAAHRLWQRLHVEQATRSVASRRWENRVEAYRDHLIQAWLDQSAAFPHATLAVQRAAQLWNYASPHDTSIVVDASGSVHNDYPWSTAVALIQAWLRLEDDEGLHQAVTWLQWEPLASCPEEDATLRRDVAACLHEALGQALTQQNQNATMQLIQRMQALDAMPGWEGVQTLADDLIQRVFFAEEALLEMPAGDDDGNNDRATTSLLSSFEATSLLLKLTEIVQQAGPNDATKIERVEQHWENIAEKDAPAATALKIALLGYYTRVDRLDVAMSWWERIAVTTTSYDALMPHALPLLVAWTRSGHVRAPWRAQEILTRLEQQVAHDKNGSGGGSIMMDDEQSQSDDDKQNNNNNVVAVDARIYAAVARQWLDSAEPKAGQKATEICLRAPFFDLSLLKIAAAGLARDAQSTPNAAVQAFGLFLPNLKYMNENEALVVAQQLGTALARHGEAGTCGEIVQYLARHQMQLEEQVLVDLLQTFENVENTVRFLIAVPARQKNLSLLQAAVLRVLELEHDNRFPLVEPILNSLCTKIVDGNIVVQDTATFGDFLTHLFRELSRDENVAIGDVWRMLKMAEKRLLNESTKTSLLPLSCYTTMMESLGGRGYDIWYICQRALAVYESGYQDFRPDARFLAFMVGRRDCMLQIVEKLVHDMLAYFRESGDVRYKPKAVHFKLMLSALPRNHPTKEVIENARALLQEMVHLEAHLNDKNDSSAAEAFNLGAHLIVQSGVYDTFAQCRDLYQTMEACHIPENEASLHNLLRACHRCQRKEREEALTTAVNVFEKMRKHGFANEARYALMIKTLSRVVPNPAHRYKLVERIFLLSCQDGYVGDQVRAAVESALDEQYMNKLVQAHGLHVGGKPAEWSHRNVNAQNTEDEKFNAA